MFIAIKIFVYVVEHRPSAVPEIKSGIAGYCIDDHHNSVAPGTAVDMWSCNGTKAQSWTARNNTIRHAKTACLTAQSHTIVSDSCNGSAQQVWVATIDGYENPTTAQCLAAPARQGEGQLLLAACTSLTQPAEAWEASTWSKFNTAAANTSCSGSQGQMVACEAAKQWVAWHSSAANHNSLLNLYADGNGYEEWCADFVSYVYKQAGHSFSGGERDDWDEYLAGNIQYAGNFTYHAAAGYIPQAGDVAYFDYPGGHVEIVAVGGAKPIFIYGDSGTTDPTTNNGQMAENTITVEPTEGQVLYYLSPN